MFRHHLHSSFISRLQPLNQVLPAVDTLILLIRLGGVRTRNSLDEVLEVGVAKVPNSVSQHISQ